MPFSSIDTWVFDLDDTLYPASSNFFPQIAERMGLYVAEALDLPLVEWASTGTFENLLKQKGKLGGQHKVPRLSMTPRWVEAVSSMKIGTAEVPAALP